MEALGKSGGASVGSGQNVTLVAEDTALDSLLVAVRHAEEVVVDGDAGSTAVLGRRAGRELASVLKYRQYPRHQLMTSRIRTGKRRQLTAEQPHLMSPSMLEIPIEPLPLAEQSASSTTTVLTTVEGHSLKMTKYVNQYMCSIFM